MDGHARSSGDAPAGRVAPPMPSWEMVPLSLGAPVTAAMSLPLREQVALDTRSSGVTMRFKGGYPVEL